MTKDDGICQCCCCVGHWALIRVSYRTFQALACDLSRKCLKSLNIVEMGYLQVRDIDT